MGIYLNPNNLDFQQALNSKIYVDKSMLIEHTNSEIYTEQKYICVSRPRRFGKSMTANMLAAYYSRGCDSKEMFSDLKISQAESFKKHLNCYNVIRLNMVEFLDSSKSMDEMLKEIQKALLFDLLDEFPDVKFYDETQLVRTLKDIFAQKTIPFIFIIDEWDCIFRIHKNNTEVQTKYLDFLRNLLKDQSYVALAYMTGILPIKKYGEHSALNIFTEVSMTNPREYAEFTGFTETEVKQLCEEYEMSFEETKQWYNGYNLKGVSIYNPRSVVMSMTGHDFDNYWTSTETYEALKIYIEMNFDGLRDTIIQLLAGEKAVIDTTTFSNDMITFKDKDDVLTLLLHLGYLTYDFFTKEVWIPNYEISQQFASTIKIMGWSEVANRNQGGIIMTQEQLKQAAEYWNKKDRRCMPQDQLKKVVDDYVNANNVCALATGTGDYVRCTPLEYSYHDGKFWIFSEGGEKFIGLAQNENVCLAVFDGYDGFHNLKSVQVMGKAEIIEPSSACYNAHAEYKKIPLSALEKLESPMNLICITPVKIEALFSDFKKDGYDIRQTLKF